MSAALDAPTVVRRSRPELMLVISHSPREVAKTVEEPSRLFTASDFLSSVPYEGADFSTDPICD